MEKPNGEQTSPVPDNMPLGLAEALAAVAASQTLMARSIQTYTHSVNKLSTFTTRLIPDEQARMAKYIRGFNPEIDNVMSGHNLAIFHKSYGEALLENQAQDLHGKKALVPPVSSSSFIQKPALTKPASSIPTSQKGNYGNNQTRKFHQKGQNTVLIPLNINSNCFRCEKALHPTTTCDGKPATCFHCYEVGHKANACPDKKPTSPPVAADGIDPIVPEIRIDGKLYMLIELEDNEDDDAEFITGT